MPLCISLKRFSPMRSVSESYSAVATLSSCLHSKDFSGLVLAAFFAFCLSCDTSIGLSCSTRSVKPDSYNRDSYQVFESTTRRWKITIWHSLSVLCRIDLVTFLIYHQPLLWEIAIFASLIMGVLNIDLIYPSYFTLVTRRLSIQHLTC